eukprot:Gregarina_sp_Pseudo_9__2644@NODE_28_length_5588_cov_42_609299_g26_i0_p2_GENE_NODE_28_length_5588_cov_42_609299_g26_i0NODE_28_length_5588_cov_42_609299_g26_i0_p2_ORF_typecomplete_len732_score88_40IIGP/PF05049_13/0_04IIGP/PF05049_13/8_1e21Dynamin_N/PF00350_23/0_087Dynamin_N/PF00350_23/1_3e04Ribosomal_L7Ae/PF01248_26/1_9e03Ribosomal_L7Ae/PF01248_26/0_38MMR_HSR1/PF01926_23/0_21_NODE_28_length_5588_cov_42_609299_g26_i031315326
MVRHHSVSLMALTKSLGQQPATHYDAPRVAALACGCRHPQTNHDRQHALKVVDDIVHLPVPANPVYLEMGSKTKWLPVPTQQLQVEASHVFRRRGAAYRIGVIGDTESKYEILKALEFDEILEQIGGGGFARSAGQPNPLYSERIGIGTEEDGRYIGPYAVGLRQDEHSVMHPDTSCITNRRFELFSYPSYYDMPVKCYMYRYKTFAMSLLLRLFTSRLTEKDEELAIFCHHLGIPLAFVHTEGNALSERFLGKPGKLVAVPSCERTAYGVVNELDLASHALPPFPHSVLSGSGLLTFNSKWCNSKSTGHFLVCSRTLLTLTRGGGRQSCFDELQLLHWIRHNLVKKHSWSPPVLKQIESLLLPAPVFESESGTTEEDLEFQDPSFFRIAFAGDQGAGRSSLLHVLFGLPPSPEGYTSCVPGSTQRVAHPVLPDIVGYELPGRKPGTVLNGFEYFQKHKLNKMSAVLIVYESDLEDGHFTVARACADAGIPFAFVHSKADQGLDYVLTAIPDLKTAVRQIRNEFTCVIERRCRTCDVKRPKIFLISVREYRRLKSADDLRKCPFDEEALLCWIFSQYRSVNPTYDCPLQVFLGVSEPASAFEGAGAKCSSSYHSESERAGPKSLSSEVSANSGISSSSTTGHAWESEMFASASSASLSPPAFKALGSSQGESAEDLALGAGMRCGSLEEVRKCATAIASPPAAVLRYKRKSKSLLFSSHRSGLLRGAKTAE